MIFKVENYQTLRRAVEDVSSFLSERDVPTERIFDSRLVMSELIGNVLRHAKGIATLGVEVREGFVELHVCSETPFTPPAFSRKADLYAESGRGLFLVDSVSAERKTTAEGGILVRIKIVE
ncbi:MAG: hypothetical protein IJW60_00035 [Clostridia bacterium]|nr:hypothetical protein [Clostridia bacterium]